MFMASPPHVGGQAWLAREVVANRPILLKKAVFAGAAFNRSKKRTVLALLREF
jgi:hypothetical protein